MDQPPSAIALAILILCQWINYFIGQFSQLKHLRLRAEANAPKDWLSHWDALRNCEWNIAQALQAGARQVLAGDQLDIASLAWGFEPDAGFQPVPPATCQEMHRRFEQVARFHADPVRYIARHTARIALRGIGRLLPPSDQAVAAAREIVSARGEAVGHLLSPKPPNTLPRGPPPFPNCNQVRMPS